jgi:hypothetical protein
VREKNWTDPLKIVSARWRSATTLYSLELDAVAEEGAGDDGVTMISSGPQAGELDLAFFVFN